MLKFLSYEDRMIIAQRLQENASFGAIGKELGKDRTTIAREIKKYSYDRKSGRPGYPYNPCKFRATCKAKKCVERAVHINPLINELMLRVYTALFQFCRRRLFCQK